MKQFDEVEILFIREVLDQYGDDLVDQLYDTIVEKKLRVSDQLLDSLSQTVTMEGNNPKIMLSFFTYGRSLDANHYKKKESVWETNTNRSVWGIKENRPRKSKKNTQWYSKNVYGSLNRLISILSNEYSETEKERLKTILKLQKERATINL